MPGMHRELGWASYRSLPEWQKKWWPVPGRTLAAYCNLPDDLGWQWPGARRKQYRRLLVFGRRLIPHGPPDRDFNPVWLTKSEHDQDRYLALLDYYVSGFVRGLKRGDRRASLEFAGIIAHIVQDGCYPSHAISNAVFYENYPRAPGRSSSFHTIIDSAPVKPVVRRPAILGTSAREIGYRLWVRLENSLLRNKQELPAIVDAINSRRASRLNRLLQSSCDEAVELVASVWYSGICLGAGRHEEPAEKMREELGKFPLEELIPYYCHPGGGYVSVQKNASVVSGRLRPLFLPAPGNKRAGQVAHGLGMTSFNSAKYLVDTAVFDRLRCIAGLSPVGLDELGPNVRVRFAVETDRRINRESPPDLEYINAVTIFETALAPGKTRPVDVSIAGARTLIISAFGMPVRGRYPFPHVVIADPVLVKKQGR